jgi:hypothetical protein
MQLFTMPARAQRVSLKGLALVIFTPAVYVDFLDLKSAENLWDDRWGSARTGKHRME